jgi:transposase
MSQKITATHARVDDISAIIAPLTNMRGAALGDTHVPTNGHWEGLSRGGTTVVWVAFLLAEGDHRRYRVEPWVKAHQRTRRRCIGRQVNPRDLTDDRWAASLDYLRVADHGAAFERARNQSVLRVDDLQGRLVRVDTTTAAADVTPEGLFHLGHSTDHRPDLPQVKRALAVLDPLGLPWTMTVVAGQTADAPRSLPAIANVRQVARTTGLTSVGDGKMAALGTRAEIVAHPDDDWGPLSATQMPAAERDRGRDPVLRHVLAPSAIRLPNADGAGDETDEPVALGFASTVESSAPEQSGQSQTWHERRLVVRSLAFAASQEKPVRHRGACAVAAINARDERKPGKPRLPDAAAASHTAATIMAHHRVEGLVQASVTTEGHAPGDHRAP